MPLYLLVVHPGCISLGWGNKTRGIALLGTSLLSDPRELSTMDQRFTHIDKCCSSSSCCLSSLSSSGDEASASLYGALTQTVGPRCCDEVDRVRTRAMAGDSRLAAKGT